MVEDLIIPQQLCKEEFRFLKIRVKGKEPTTDMGGWQEKNFKYNDIELLNHLKIGGNYAIIGGYGNLILIDSDSNEINEICKRLPETFTIKTGSPEEYKKHYYYITDEKVKPIRLSKKGLGDLGDVRSVGQYVVAPNSTHPKGGKYKVIKDIQIAKVSEKFIRSMFQNYIDPTESTDFKEFPINTKKRSSDFIRNCNVPDYVLNNKIKGGTSKNWKLFPYIVDILYNREVTQSVYVALCKRQGHSMGAIKGWVKKAHEGKLAKTSCEKMKDYLKRFHADKIDEICGDCPLYKSCNKPEAIFTPKGQAESYIKEKPIFYDKAGLWWMWNLDETFWERVDEVDILNMIEESTGQDIITPKKRTIIINSLKQSGRKKIPENIKKTWIQFKNIIVDIETGEQFPANPKYFVTNPIPWEISKYENTPMIDKIFEEWVGKDYIQTLYEIIAYCLLSNYPIHRIFCFIGEGLNGKCQKGTDKILLSNGQWKNIKDIKVKDEIISPQKDGSYKFVKVINTHNRFEKDVYDVYEKRRKKRLLYTCAGNHIIPIIRTWTKRTSKDDSTPRIMKRKLFEYDAKHISKLDNSKSQICSFTTTPINYKQKDAIINPYCLGAWLGDGHFSIRKIRLKGQDKSKYKLDNGKYVLGKGLGITTEDKEVINEFYKNYNEDMKGITNKINNKANTYRISVNGKFANQLTELNLNGKGSGKKFIPKECLLSSINYRKELLAGLIDTDGFVQKKTGAVYYTTKSKQLSKDIKDLVFSLGGYAEIRNVKKKSQFGYEGNYFELSIQFQDYNIPLRIKKKKERLFSKKYSPRNIAIECVKTKPQQVYGIEIEGDSKWYITNDWMVTHNSKFLELLRKFVGEKNVCSTELDTLLTSRFEITRLHKKLVCQMGETNFNEMSKTSILKKLSGGDLIGYEYKRADLFEEINYAKILISTNNLPTTTDKTIGFYRRWCIIDFPNRFSEKKEILEDIPEEEYGSLAAKCLIILKNLLEKREFHKEGTIEERMKKYEDKSDPLEKFIKEYTEENFEGYIWKNEFEKKLNQWCQENRFRTMSSVAIGKKMKEKGIEQAQKYEEWMSEYGKKGGRAWVGITWLLK